MPGRPRIWSRDWRREFAGELTRVASSGDGLRTTMVLTAIIVLLQGGNMWYVAVPTGIIISIGLIWRRLLLWWPFWSAVAMILLLGTLRDWDSADNHKYLICYWALAVACCLPWHDREQRLALNARWLIGLAFFFATIWKIISPDYLDGTFFHHVLLLDTRFSHVTHFFTDTSRDTLAGNWWARESFSDFKGGEAQLVVQGTPDVVPVALFITWWGVLLEGQIAVLFLLPARGWSENLRDGSLLVFIVATYAIANVVGFGWILATMGFAQCRPERKWWRVSYLCAFVLVLVFDLPIARLSARFTGIDLPLAD